MRLLLITDTHGSSKVSTNSLPMFEPMQFCTQGISVFTMTAVSSGFRTGRFGST